MASTSGVCPAALTQLRMCGNAWLCWLPGAVPLLAARRAYRACQFHCRMRQSFERPSRERPRHPVVVMRLIDLISAERVLAGCWEVPGAPARVPETSDDLCVCEG